MFTNLFIIVLFSLFMNAWAYSCSNHVHVFKHYKCVKDSPIGIGSEGKAYLIEAHNIQYVLKVQNISRTSNNELNILIKLKGKPFTVQLIDSKKFESKLYMIISYGHQGTLTSFMNKSDYLNEYSNVITFMNKLMIGLKEIHSAGYVHADFKPDNIVIDKDNNPLIIDYDVSVRINQTQMPRGTLSYMPPEIVQHFIFEEELRYTSEMDVYALGVIFYKLVKHNVPIEMKSLKYNKMLNSPIEFNKSDYKNFYEFVFKTVQPASNRIGNNEAKFLLNEMEDAPFSEKLRKTVSYKLKDYANNTELLTNEYEDKNIVLMLLVILVVLTLALVFIVKKIKKKFFTKDINENHIFEDLTRENKI
jgi:serine/threonine protein kinase